METEKGKWRRSYFCSGAEFVSQRKGVKIHEKDSIHFNHTVYNSPGLVRREPESTGKLRYYHNHGVFYQRGPSGFLVVNPPIGAIVLSIPIGSRSMLVGGFTYYLYGGTYYRRVPSGYMVAAPPPETVVVREMAPVVPSKESMEGKVSVTVPLLNVRSGPGMDFPVTCQVHENEMLTIQGYAPDWLYVNIPGGAFGWVMLRYTSYASTNPRPAEG